MIKYLWAILIFLTMSVTALAEDFMVTGLEYIAITGQPSDTLGRTMLTPDSIRIVVTDSNQTELFDAWFEDADAQCTLNGDIIAFSDQWDDINGAASIGHFIITATIASDDQNNVDVYSNFTFTVLGLITPINTARDSALAALARLDNIQVATDSMATVHADANKGNLKANVSALALEASLTDTLSTIDKAVLVDLFWDEPLTGAEHNAPTSGGRRVRGIESGVIATGTAQRGGANYIVLAAAESEVDDYYKGHIVKIIAGTGLDQQKSIHDYTGSTDSITLHHGDEWTTNPDGSSVYDIISGSGVEVIHMDAATLDSVAKGIWDALVADHTTPLSFGDTLPKMLQDFGTINDIQAIIDTSNYWNSYGPTASSIHKRYTTRDTLFMKTSPTDTLGYAVFWHIAGRAGGSPDSTTAYVGTPSTQ